MDNLNRRTFLKTCSTAAAAIQMGLLSGWTEELPKMCIAKYSSSPKEADGIAEEADRLTRKAIEAIGGISRFISKGDVVWIKPNIGWDRRPEQAANTNPHVVATIIKLCYEVGAKKVVISDNPCNDQRRTFANSQIQQEAEKAGAHVFFLDPRKYKKMAMNGKVLKEWEIYTDVVESNKVINVPIAKHHQLTTVTLSMKNLMGVIGGARDRYHQDSTNTLPDLAAFIKPQLTVLDAIRILTGNGPVGGNLKDVQRKDLIVAGTDYVAIDAFGATLLGHKPEDIGHIKEANARGLGKMDYASLSPKEITV